MLAWWWRVDWLVGGEIANMEPSSLKASLMSSSLEAPLMSRTRARRRKVQAQRFIQGLKVAYGENILLKSCSWSHRMDDIELKRRDRVISSWKKVRNRWQCKGENSENWERENENSELWTWVISLRVNLDRKQKCKGENSKNWTWILSLWVKLG